LGVDVDLVDFLVFGDLGDLGDLAFGDLAFLGDSTFFLGDRVAAFFALGDSVFFLGITPAFEEVVVVLALGFVEEVVDLVGAFFLGLDLTAVVATVVAFGFRPGLPAFFFLVLVETAVPVEVVLDEVDVVVVVVVLGADFFFLSFDGASL